MATRRSRGRSPSTPERWTPSRSRCWSSRRSASALPRRRGSRRPGASPRRSSPARRRPRRALARRDRPGAWLLSERPDIGIGGARDIGPAVERAARGGRLDPLQLVDVMVTLDAASRLRDALAEELGRSCTSWAAASSPCHTSVAAWRRASIRRASCSTPPRRRLGGLRRNVRVAYERLRTRLEQLVHGSELAGALQEPIVTLRNGRYVMPVRAEAQGRVRGIVHDQSGSGQTLFIEPLVVVELGNAWREAQLAVEAEEERILDELSALVGEPGGRPREDARGAGRLRPLVRHARVWPREMDGDPRRRRPRRARSSSCCRRPPPGPAPGTVVPIDVRLGGELHGARHHGPEHGRQDGRAADARPARAHAPVRPARAGRGRAARCRSSATSSPTSATSSRWRSRSRRSPATCARSCASSEAAGPGCLVLLDELGAGTDPTEGSALAQALLDHFMRCRRARRRDDPLRRAQDLRPQHARGAQRLGRVRPRDALSPTYRLPIGLPGTSQAFAIAERLGLPHELVEDARSRLSRRSEFEATLARIREAREAAAAATERAEAAETGAREAKRAAEQERARARRERDDAFMSAREEADRALAAIREEIRRTREVLETEPLSEQRLDELERTLDGRVEAIPRPRRRGVPATEPAPPRAWEVGDHARARSSGWSGRIVAIDAAARRSRWRQETCGSRRGRRARADRGR